MGTSLLGENEYLLRNQKIKGTQKIDKEELNQFYRQEPNRKFPLIPVSPYVWFYEWGAEEYDQDSIQAEIEQVKAAYNQQIATTGKEKKQEKLEKKKRKKVAKLEKDLNDGNILMRWGEPLAIYDSSLSLTTAEQMELYMNTKGFFNAQVDYRIKKSGQKVKVIYQVQEGEPHRLDTIVYRSADATIDSLIQAHENQSLLRENQRYDQANLTLERERIDKLLKDHGYFNFSRQYINFKVYDTLENKRLAIEAVISEPRTGSHKQFMIDSVIFVTDEGIINGNLLRGYEPYNGVTYKYYDKKYSEKILDQRLFLYPGELYSQQNTFETQRQLNNLDMFKFVNIYYDTTGGQFTANIFASPLKKFTTSNEVGLGIIVAQGFPGPFYNLTFRNRNVFGGLEHMEINGRIGIEGVPSASNDREIYRSTEAGGNFSLIFPQFILPLSKRTKRRLGNINPNTRVVAGSSFTNRPEYLRTTFNSSLSYTWQKDIKRFFNFTLVDLNLIYSNNLSKEFRDRLEEFEDVGNNLINSFLPSFVNSVSFTSIFNFNRYGTNPDRASFLKLNLENGGTFLNLTGTAWLEDFNLEYYKYAKLDADFRRYRPLPQSTSLAYRFHLGVALPYGANNILPYEKYFFAGGSSGNRAWRPRRLGPGSYTPIDSSGAVNYRFEQQAEIIFESSIELRRKIVGFLDGALFVDVGNSWTVEEDPIREGAKFDPENFYKEMAVGGGLGVRLDFTFLLVRLDAGMKLYDPARPEGKRFILDPGYYDPPFNTPLVRKENIILNIGIGYPF